MTLEERINEDLKSAMKSGDKVRLDTVRSIRTGIIEYNKSGAGKSMGPDEEIKLLNSAAKKRRDAIEMYKQANRPELLAKEEEELRIIQEYLPKQLTNDEIKEIINKIVISSGAQGMKEMGKVMGLSMKELSGKADGNVVQGLVKEILGAM